MKKIFLIIVFSPFLMFCQKGNTEKLSPMQQNKTTENQQKTSDETEILALTRQFTSLMISKNTSELNKIVDKNFTLTHITGRVQSKNDWFAEIEAESMKYYSAEEVEHSLKINGKTAEFIQKNRLDARIWGSRNTWRLQQTMTLEKRDGKWIILKSVARTF